MPARGCPHDPGLRATGRGPGGAVRWRGNRRDTTWIRRAACIRASGDDAAGRTWLGIAACAQRTWNCYIQRRCGDLRVWTTDWRVAGPSQGCRRGAVRSKGGGARYGQNVSITSRGFRRRRWNAQRRTSGRLRDFCHHFLGRAYPWPKVMNPALKDGACKCPSKSLRGPTFGSMTAAQHGDIPRRCGVAGPACPQRMQLKVSLVGRLRFIGAPAFWARPRRVLRGSTATNGTPACAAL